LQPHIIRAAGFKATVDAFAQHGEQLWFISMLGSQSACGGCALSGPGS
jgi:hypothetical protein